MSKMKGQALTGNLVDRETDRRDFREVIASLPFPLLLADEQGEVSFINTAAEATFGLWVIGLSLNDLFASIDLDTVARASGEARQEVRTKQGSHYEARLRKLSDGSWLVDLRPGPAKSNTFESVSTDELTGLATRNSFALALSTVLADASVTRTVSVLCLDLDRFKLVNDTLGHEIGDELLKKVAGRIVAACRKEDVIGRAGGDEFVIVQVGAGIEGAESLATRLIDLLGRTYVLRGHTVNIGVSIGIGVASAPMQGRDLVRNADLALYEAKRAGRARYRLFESGMDAALRKRRELEIDLRRAIALKQFELHYQPFVDLTTNRVIGFEALLRWAHPVRGNVPPLDFISLAEESGLIVKIGEWVLRTACETASSWPGEMIVAVNVSPLQFRSDNLLQSVVSALSRSGLPAHRLEIEITEGALLDDTDNVLTILRALRELGVKISMDDFGTGYSSLSYLQKFPFSKIKIDRSFIANSHSDSEAILKAISSLGTGLGMAITAEGVETEEQLARIRTQQCTHVQGYLTGRPMASGSIGEFLQKQIQKSVGRDER